MIALFEHNQTANVAAEEMLGESTNAAVIHACGTCKSLDVGEKKENDSVPLVSVLMGVRYRRDDTGLLKRAVESILEQTYKNIELIICYRDSTVSSLEYLRECSEKDKRLVLIDGSGCVNFQQQLNTCIRNARGTWLARMDDDDYSHPERFQKQLEYMLLHPEVHFLGCNVNIYRDGKLIGERKFPQYPSVKDFYITQPFIHPTLLFRRECMEEVGGYSEEKSCELCEDYELLLRMYEKGRKGANIQEKLFDYSIPSTAKGSRKMSHRINESITRYKRFKSMGLLPGAALFVVKPIVVGLLSEKMLRRVKGLPK